MKLALLVALAGTMFAQAPDACDRACLEGFVNQYLDALVAHNPFGLPLARKVKFSENDVVLDLGDGVWSTITGMGTYKLYVSDPQSGQVGFFGTMRENSAPIALSARLKIENRKITEIETVINRGGGGGPPRGGGAAVMGPAESLEKMGPDAALTETVAPAQRVGRDTLVLFAGTPDPILLETVPMAERLPRTELIAKSNLYFEAIEQGNGQVAPFDPNCERFENGTRTTPKEGCSAQLDTKIFDYIQKIAPRRFLVVDEERQVVFGFFMFNHPGDITWVNSPGQGRHEMPGAAKRPFNVDVAEAFRIKNGMIRKVEALITSLPYGLTSPFVPEKP